MKSKVVFIILIKSPNAVWWFLKIFRNFLYFRVCILRIEESIFFEVALFRSLSILEFGYFGVCLFWSMSILEYVYFGVCLFWSLSILEYVCFGVCLCRNMSISYYNILRVCSWMAMLLVDVLTKLLMNLLSNFKLN